MALWIRRKTNEIVCAAFNDASENGDDIYIDDAVHYWLSTNGLIYTEDEGDTWKILSLNKNK